MKLHRLRVEQFRRFRQPFELADLEDGLNLFTGPNEAGKSTLVAALRAAFFERHRSSSVDDLRPWGDPAAAPSVELDFSAGGQEYRLSKRFLGKKRCELRWGGGQLDGDEAEEHLAALLGFQHAGRGASKAEHWGIPGLLWIEQGRGQELREALDHASEHLRRALNTSLGEVTASGGDKVLERVEAERNALLTAATGQPRGAYLEARREESALSAALAEADGEIARYRDQVDRLAALRKEQAATELARPWLALREQEKQALAALEEIRGVEQEVLAARQQSEQADRRVALLRGQLQGFADQEKEARLRAAALESARGALAEATATLARWTGAQSAAQARADQARHILRLARQEEQRRSLSRQIEAMATQRAANAETLAAAQDVHAELRERQKQAAVVQLADADLARLEEQHSRLREIRIRQESSATRLDFVLEDGRSLLLGGESLSGSGTRRLVGHTTLDLPGLGRLDIVPGGADLPKLERDAADLEERHSVLLRSLGLNSVEEARVRHQEARRLEGEIQLAAARLKSLAPKGLDALLAERDSLAARANELALAQPPAPIAAAAGLPSLAEAEAAEDGSRRTLDEVNRQCAAAQVAVGHAQAVCDAAEREAGLALAQIQHPEWRIRRDEASRALTDGLAEQTTLAARIQALDRRIAEARPDILRQDAERYRRSAEEQERAFNERGTAILKLEVALQSLGARGLDEVRAGLERDLAQVRRRVMELERRARALDHLLGLLRNARQALTRRLQLPLQRHLQRYLDLLFPGAALEIDADLGPVALLRDGADGGGAGEFDALSFGAREQMGVISRLAYADLLREAGRPTLIVLDDALVHSDETRLAQMKRVLFDAASRHQILLFSCHPEKWLDLGVRPRALMGEMN